MFIPFDSVILLLEMYQRNYSDTDMLMNKQVSCSAISKRILRDILFHVFFLK